jgi:hypothetical protein
MFSLNLLDPEKAILYYPDQNICNLQPWHDRHGKICAYTYKAGDFSWMYWPGTAIFRFGTLGEQVDYFPEGRQNDENILDLFWRSVAPIVLQARGKEALHASAVRTETGIAAFCGISGTGKSTLAYGLMKRGFGLWTDDALVFHFDSQGVNAIPLPSSLRLLPDTLSFFIDKTSIPADLLRPKHLNEEPLKIIILLDRQAQELQSDEICSIHLQPKEAFLQILAHAYCFSLEEKTEKKRLMTDYMDLVERVPIMQIHYPANLARIEELIQHVEALIS